MVRKGKTPKKSKGMDGRTQFFSVFNFIKTHFDSYLLTTFKEFRESCSRGYRSTTHPPPKPSDHFKMICDIVDLIAIRLKLTTTHYFAQQTTTTCAIQNPSSMDEEFCFLELQFFFLSLNLQNLLSKIPSPIRV